MTTPMANKSVIQPRLEDVLLNLKQDIFSTLNCHMPGLIQSFNADACTAVVQPVFKRMLANGTVVSRPVLVDCPVLFPGGGGGRLTFPVSSGDQCLILYQDRRIDEWFQTGSQQLPADPRMHDISDGIVFVGLDPTGAMGPVPTDRVELSYLGSKFQVTSTGWNFVGDGGAEIDLAAAIVTIKNNTTTLLTLLNGLIDVIAAATIQTSGTPPLTAVTIAALQAYKLQLATLLG
jgi:hypothetical protein